LKINKTIRTFIVAGFIIAAIIGSHFVLHSSNVISLLALPFSWIFVSIFGPGPAFIIPNLTAAGQALAYGLFLGGAWIDECFRKKLVVLASVHIVAIIVIAGLVVIRSLL
jgi:hypothetical protein